MAPAFAWKTKEKSDAMEVDKNVDSSSVKLDGQQHLLLAMLLDNAESKVQIVQNVTSVFLTSCYPEYYAPARYLLLLIAGERYVCYSSMKLISVINYDLHLSEIPYARM